MHPHMRHHGGKSTKGTPTSNGIVVGIAIVLALSATSHSCDEHASVQQRVSHHG